MTDRGEVGSVGEGLAPPDVTTPFSPHIAAIAEPSSERKGDRLRWKEPACTMKFYVQITAVNHIKFLRAARTVGDACPYRFDGIYSQDKSRKSHIISLFRADDRRSPLRILM